MHELLLFFAYTFIFACLVYREMKKWLYASPLEWAGPEDVTSKRDEFRWFKGQQLQVLHESKAEAESGREEEKCIPLLLIIIAILFYVIVVYVTSYLLLKTCDLNYRLPKMCVFMHV